MATVITKRELIEIYENNSNHEAARLLGVSVNTLMRVLRENGIETKGKGVRQGKLIVVDEESADDNQD